MMEVKLAENIKKFRKERKMTQEMLAEAMGVSISAVYKWESGQSIPEIHLIFEMADLFHVSLDVLLGYHWRNHHVSSVLERIATLKEHKCFDEAVKETEKALKNYPNNFDIVYTSALLFLELCETNRKNEWNLRAIELFEHACELIDQNEDETISEVSIRTQIAQAYLMMNRIDKALSILKKYNVCGVNDAMIGMVLADYLHNADEAEKYLGHAFMTFAEEINSIMVGYANVFFQRKNYDAVIECFKWLRIVLRGTQSQTELTWFDKYECVILETMAECYCLKKEFDQAKKVLKEAIIKAKRYDSASFYEIADMKFFTMLNLKKQPNYDFYGKTAMDCLTRRILPNDEIPELWKIWLELVNEGEENETI